MRSIERERGGDFFLLFLFLDWSLGEIFLIAFHRLFFFLSLYWHQATLFDCSPIVLITFDRSADPTVHSIFVYPVVRYQ
jgi:hypothetical protein